MSHGPGRNSAARATHLDAIWSVRRRRRCSLAPPPSSSSRMQMRTVIAQATATRVLCGPSSERDLHRVQDNCCSDHSGARFWRPQPRPDIMAGEWAPPERGASEPHPAGNNIIIKLTVRPDSRRQHTGRWRRRRPRDRRTRTLICMHPARRRLVVARSFSRRVSATDTH